jgi:hypothetical protein
MTARDGAVQEEEEHPGFVAEPAAVLDNLIRRSQTDPLLKTHIDAAMWEAVARQAKEQLSEKNKKPVRKPPAKKPAR